MRALVICDKVEPILYSAGIKRHVGDVDLIISCGDLPHYYLEYTMTMLGRQVYYVNGNHARDVEYQAGKGDAWQARNEPMGAINLHCTTAREGSLLMAGLEGSIRYNSAPRFQYTQTEMWMNVYRLAPKLLLNRIRFGRYLDVLVAHSPPWGIHDQDDRPHQGFKSFLAFMRWFKPRYLLHGHIHLYRRDVVTQTRYCETEVINAYPYRILDLGVPPAAGHSRCGARLRHHGQDTCKESTARLAPRLPPAVPKSRPWPRRARHGRCGAAAPSHLPIAGSTSSPSSARRCGWRARRAPTLKSWKRQPGCTTFARARRATVPPAHARQSASCCAPTSPRRRCRPSSMPLPATSGLYRAPDAPALTPVETAVLWDADKLTKLGVQALAYNLSMSYMRGLTLPQRRSNMLEFTQSVLIRTVESMNTLPARQEAAQRYQVMLEMLEAWRREQELNEEPNEVSPDNTGLPEEQG